MSYKVFIEPHNKSQDTVKVLARHVRDGLKASGLKWDEVKVERSYILLTTPDEVEAIELIAKYPGVSYAGIVEETSPRFDDVINSICEVAKRVLYPDESFKLSVEQEGPFPYKSRDVEVVASSKLLEMLASKNVRIDEAKPHKTIYVKVVKDAAYVFYDKFEGVGGLPVGSQGEAVTMIDSDVRSGVASFLSLRSGLLVHPIIYDLRPIIDSSYLQKALKVVLRLRESLPIKKLKLAIIKSLRLATLKERCPKKALPIVLRRMMLRSAGLYADRLNIKMIVCHENFMVEPSWLFDALMGYASSLHKHLIFPLLTLTEKEIRDYAEKLKLAFSGPPSILRLKGHYPQDRLEVLEQRLGIDKMVEDGFEKAHLISLDKDLHQILNELD